jgi:hypothetical protein
VDSSLLDKDSTQSLPDRLPRRDWVILPLLSIMTIGMLFILTEVTTRLVWTQGGKDSCRIHDPIAAWRYKAFCTERMKSPEGPWVDYTFNDCGYRTATSCGNKPPGTVRIALLGSSTSMGLMVAGGESFAALTGDELSKLCDRPVEFQNLGAVGSEPIYAYQRVDEALALKPDAVMLAIAPFDIQQDIDPRLLATRQNPLLLKISHPRCENESIFTRMRNWLSESRTVIVARHFLYENQKHYLRLFLLQGDSADFLRVPFSPAWDKRLTDLDLLLGEMAAKIHRAHIPFVLTVIPGRAQAALLGLRDLPTSVDPYALDRRFAKIAAKYDIIFVDSFTELSRIHDAETLFYPADGHLAATGHALLSRVLVRGLTSGRLPALSACSAVKP